VAHVPASARDQLILGQEPLVQKTFWDFWPRAEARGIEADDLLQAGRLGLVEAAETWNPIEFPGVPFGAWARRFIRRQFRQELDRGPLPGTGFDLDRQPDRRRSLPRLEPLFGCRPFEPGSPCPHYVPIPRGRLIVCAVCHRSGWDHHPLMQRSSGTDPHRDQRPAALKIHEPPPCETRRQRRARIFGSPAAAQ